jgi:microcystin degradation protein MlrC
MLNLSFHMMKHKPVGLMRVGVIALQHESNTFLPTRTTLEDFRRGILARGDELLAAYVDAHHEVGGFLEGLRAERVEPVPIFAAWATPSGTVVGEAYRALLDLMLEGLQSAGRLDGLLVAPHGAGVCEDPDMDGHWLTLLRRQVGPDVPMICTLDCHANLSPRMIEACQATIAYRTNPHLDQRRRGLEAAALMARTLRGEIRPVQAASFPPVAINIASQETDAAPARDLIAQADAQLARGGRLLSNSVLFGFPYADVPEMGSSFIAVADGDLTLARSAADELAGWVTTHRHAFVPDLPGVEEAVSRAADLDGPVCLLDVGDNVGGGSPADGTLIAHALHSRGLGRSFVCLCDPAAARQALDAGPGAKLQLSMGGKTDPLHGPPLVTTVTVIGVHGGRFTESQPRHGGKTAYDMGATVVVETSGGLIVMLTIFRTPPFSLNQLLSCGIRPEAYQVLVAKGVNAPIAAYRPVCKHFIRVNTPGVTAADPTLLPYRNRRRPMFPFEDVA